MAQAVNLAVGATGATGSDITVASGAFVSVGIYRDAGELNAGARATIFQDTPGADVQIGILDENNPVQVVVGPGTFRVTRVSNSNAENYGIFTES